MFFKEKIDVVDDRIWNVDICSIIVVNYELLRNSDILEE